MLRKNAHVDALNPNSIGGKYYQKKYFSSNQGLVFIGPYLVDEVVACNYEIQQAKIPIYGYASSYYDVVAPGKIIVTGNLTINYIDSAYLYYVMFEQIAKNANNTSSQLAVKAAVDSSNSRTTEIDNILYGVNSPLSDNKGQQNNPTTARDMKKISQFIAQDPQGSQRVMRELREKYWGTANSTNRKDQAFRSNVSAASIRAFANGQSLKSMGETILHARPDQMPAINITVSHGNPLDSKHNTFRVLKDVDFMGGQMHISPSGQPQLETYNFIARSIEY